MSAAELEIAQLALENPDEYDRLLRGFKALIAIGDDPLDAADAIRRADAGEGPNALDLNADGFDERFRAALKDVRAERRQRDLNAAALLARSRMTGTAIE